MPSAQIVDENNFVTIENNPISRSGVFQYMGSSIGGDAEPGKIYNVYRPDEELADPECIESFKLLPLIDDHTMLGSAKDGFVPPERKGVHGTTGDRVDFRNGVLYSNLKIFSETLRKLIADGKKDLSLGYRCLYEKASGTYAGQSYDYIQRSLRGNHIALVDQARCDVAVLDGKQMTLDNFDFNHEDMKMPMTADEAEKEIARLKKITEDQKATLDASSAKDAEEEEKAKKEKEAKDAEEAEKKDKEAKDAEEAKKKDDDDKKGMDAAIAPLKAEIEALKKGGMKQLMGEINARNTLADKVAKHVGTFDHAEMTVDEVAAYGIDKLKIKCEKGHERAALDGYLQGRGDPAVLKSLAQDTRQESKGIDTYLKKSA